MKRLLLLLLSFGLSAQLAFSQADEVVAAMKKINAIKSDTKYLYAESTTSDWEQAYENAKALLGVEIDNWVSTQKKSEDAQGYVAKIENNFMEVKTRRGNLFRVFVYIKKDNIMPYTENDELVVSKMPHDEETTTPADTVAKSGQTIETPQVSQQKDVAETKKGKKAEKAKTEEKAKTVQYLQSSVHPLHELNEKEKTFLALNSVDGIQDYVREHASKYGKLTNMPADTELYVLVFAKDKVIAHLLHRTDAPDINLDTLQEDNLDNYKGKGWGAIWILM